jgi:hypothetical protein
MPQPPSERLRRLLESGEATLHPATLTQRELWEASPVPPGDPSNNICTVTTLKGPVSREFCERATAMVVARQEVLRLSVLPGKNGPLQLVRKSRKPALRFQVAERPGADDAAVDALITDLARTPFDLVAGPLYRVEVIRRGPGDHLLVLVIHHAIADGWSIGVFMQDLWTAYAFQVFGVSGELERVAQTYTGWGAAEREFWTAVEAGSRRDFWAGELAGARRLFSAPEPEAAVAGKRQRWVGGLPAAQVEALRKLATTHGATLFSTLLAGFQIVMAEAAGTGDVLVGSPVANRNRKPVWETMGSFAGIVPLRGRLVRGRPFHEHLAATQQMTAQCFAQAIPFVELAAALGEPAKPGRNPVFDVRFALQNQPVPDVSTPELEIEYRIRSTGTARFDLACELTETGPAIEAVWLYREDMFSAGQVARFQRRFEEVLERVCGDPGVQLDGLMQTQT